MSDEKVNKTADIKEYMKVYQKNYYETHKEVKKQKSRENGKEIIKCDICDCSFRKNNKTLHNRTNKHAVNKIKRTFDL